MTTENINNNKDMENTSNEVTQMAQQQHSVLIRQGKERSYSEPQIKRQHPEIPISKYNEFKNKYDIKKDAIGKGMFATVYYATDSAGNEYAMKRISVEKLDESRIDKFLLELHISQKMAHINIVKCHEVFRTKSHWYIVSEYCCSGTFKHLIRKMRSIESPIEREITARYYLYQLRDAIQYLHENNIIHRDLKPDNILMTKNKGASSEVIVKLSDFGFSRYFDVTETMLTTGYDDLVSTICGSPIYMAPELLIKMKYNMKADIWSFGVIMCEMLDGKNPFYIATNVPELRSIMENYKLPEKFKRFSHECQDLLQKILQNNPVNRISWEDFFNHEWFNSTTIDRPSVGLVRRNSTISSNGQDDDEDKEEQQMFELDEDLEKKRTQSKVSQSVPVFNAMNNMNNVHSANNRPILKTLARTESKFQIPKKRSEEDFIMIQKDDDIPINTEYNNNNSCEPQIKMYNETYTSSIIKILANSMVYVFGKNGSANSNSSSGGKKQYEQQAQSI